MPLLSLYWVWKPWLKKHDWKPWLKTMVFSKIFNFDFVLFIWIYLIKMIGKVTYPEIFWQGRSPKGHIYNLWRLIFSYKRLWMAWVWVLYFGKCSYYILISCIRHSIREEFIQSCFKIFSFLLIWDKNLGSHTGWLVAKPLWICSWGYRFTITKVTLRIVYCISRLQNCSIATLSDGNSGKATNVSIGPLSDHLFQK